MSYKSDVTKIYNDVIEDVASNVRDIFADEGAPEEVLHELIALWKSKLADSNALDLSPDTPQPSESQPVNPPQVQQPPPQSSVQAVAVQVEVNTVPIEITVPTEQIETAPTRTLKIQVPASSLNGPTLRKVLTGPVITATVSLPDSVATAVLQQHVQAALKANQQQGAVKKVVAMPQLDGLSDTEKKTGAFSPGPDGACDISDSDDLEQDTSVEEVMEMENSDPQQGQATDEDSLNSNDDISEEDVDDLFDTDNVVICRYDKIMRSKNKWRMSLTEGIMSLEGKDYVFSKATGDTFW